MSTALLRRLAHETGLSLEELAPPPTSTVRRYIDSQHSGGTTGLHLVVSSGGSYAWSVRVTLAATGERPRLRLGNAASMLIETAIEEARKLHDTAQAGIDPKAERLRAKEKHQQVKAAKLAARRTVRDLLDVYLARQKKQKRPSADLLELFYAEPTKETLAIKSVSRTQLKPVLALLDKPVADIDDEKAQALVRRYESRGRAMAQAALEHMRAGWNVILDDAVQRKAFGIERNPFARVQVSEAPDTTAEEDEAGTRLRALSEKEVKSLWAGLHEESIVTGGQGAQMRVKVDDRTRLALLLVLACGQRVEQTLMTRAQDIDFDEKTWSIPVAHRKIRRSLRTSKRAAAKRPHIVPLHSMALDLWRQVLELRTDGTNPWLFPSMDRLGKERHAPRDHRTLSKFVSRWCERTGAADFSPRDLRKTWTTQGGRWRLDYEVRERIMDHALPGIGAAVYDEHDYFEAMRELMDAYGAKLAELVIVKNEASNVVPLARAAAAM